MTYQTAIQLFIQSLIARNNVPAYIRHVQSKLRRFAKATLVPLPENLQPRDISDYISQLRRENNLKPSTAITHRDTIVNWLSWLSREGYIDNVDWYNRVEKIRRDRTLRQSLSDDQVCRLLITAETMDYRTPLTARRNVAMLCVLLDTGLRESECLTLRLSDVDMNTNQIRVRAENAKCRKERVVWFSATTRARLMSYMRVRRRCGGEWLWLTRNKTHPSKSLILHYVHRLGERAGLPNINVHMLRHTAATSMCRNGMSLAAVSAMLGHGSVRTTEIYLHLSRDDVRRQYEEHAPLRMYRM